MRTDPIRGIPPAIPIFSVRLGVHSVARYLHPIETSTCEINKEPDDCGMLLLDEILVTSSSVVRTSGGHRVGTDPVVRKVVCVDVHIERRLSLIHI